MAVASDKLLKSLDLDLNASDRWRKGKQNLWLVGIAPEKPEYTDLMKLKNWVWKRLLLKWLYAFDCGQHPVRRLQDVPPGISSW